MANTKKYVSLDKLSLYDDKIKKVITDGDEAALASAKSYADGLASNYDAAGAAATVQGNLETEIARAKAAEETNAAAAKKAQDEVDALELVVKNIQENAYDDTAIRGLISGLDTNKADKTQVATDIADAVKVEEEARIAAVSGVQSAINTLSGTHTTDKAALEAAIALKADQTALDAVSGVANAAATKTELQAEAKTRGDEITRVEGLVTAEAERASGVESGLNDRLEEVEAFFKLAEGETLDTALDTLKEIQTYITTEGAAADQMVLDIAANAKAIEDMDAAYKAADTSIKGRLDVLEAIDHDAYVAADTALKNELNGEINKKANQTDVDSAIQALQGADTGLGNRITSLENKFGGAEGSVEDMIADAKAEAIAAAASDAATKDAQVLVDAKAYADAEDAKIEARVDTLEAASATHALASDLTALTGRVATAEGEIDTLQGEMDAVEALAAANKAAHEANAAAIALKASQADLEAVSGRVTTLETWHNNFTEVSEEEINALFS